MLNIKFSHVTELQGKTYELASLYLRLKQENMDYMQQTGISYEDADMGVSITITDELTAQKLDKLIRRGDKDENKIEAFVNELNTRTAEKEFHDLIFTNLPDLQSKIYKLADYQLQEREVNASAPSFSGLIKVMNEKTILENQIVI
jgi:hypothetical protein